MALDRRITMQHAVREGARAAGVEADPDQGIDVTVDQAQGLVDPSAVSVCYIDEDGNGRANAMDSVRVSLTYDYYYTVPFGSLLDAIGVVHDVKISYDPQRHQRAGERPRGRSIIYGVLMMTPLIRKVNGQRGQMLVMLVLTLSVTFIIGFIVIDFGLWFSERRGAQKDADLSALAAAQELLSLTKLSDGNALDVQDAANARALDYAAKNDVADPDNVHLPDPVDSALWTACWEDIGDTSDVMDTYPLDIGHPTGALFGTIFGFTGLEDLGAHARACVGSVISPGRRDAHRRPHQ